jgi:hypothetical protein
VNTLPPGVKSPYNRSDRHPDPEPVPCEN